MTALLVDRVSWEADGVVSVRLRARPGTDPVLPAWEPGAHLELVLPSGLIRQYSLCGDPTDRTSYTVAVLREAAGRGGSAEIHDSALVGRLIEVRGPRNHFALEPASHYVFVAGGIGVTPILAMAREADRAGVPWRLHYGGRTRSSMAFISRLRSLSAERVTICPQDEVGLLDLDAIVRASPPDAVVYACGPEGLLRAAQVAGEGATPPRPVRVERFAAAAPVATSGDAFEVELRRSGITVKVPADRSMLEAIREVVPDVPWSCEEGYCGTCETRVLAGTADHRDDVLTPAQRAAGELVMICVSRAATPVIALDL